MNKSKKQALYEILEYLDQVKTAGVCCKRFYSDPVYRLREPCGGFINKAHDRYMEKFLLV